MKLVKLSLVKLTSSFTTPLTRRRGVKTGNSEAGAPGERFDTHVMMLRPGMEEDAPDAWTARRIRGDFEVEVL